MLESVDWELLKVFLFWIIGGGGAAWATFALIEEIPALKELAPKPKRYISLAIPACIAMAAYAAGVGLGYLETPIGWQAWLEGLFAVGGLAAGLGQVIHGKQKL
jgi:hypothetical protein